MNALPFTGWSKPGEILCLRPELSAAIEVLKLRHVNCSCIVVAARVRIGTVIVNGILITQGPPDIGVARQRSRARTTSQTSRSPTRGSRRRSTGTC